MNKSLDSLPFEIIEQILLCDVISYKDICTFSSVSEIFNCIGKSNKLWHSKYQQKWPKLAALFDPHKTDWKNEFRIRIQFKKEMTMLLQNMAEVFYLLDNVSDDSFFDLQKQFQSHPLGDFILVDELECIVHDPDSHLNLTHRYYAEKALRYMRHILLEVVWLNFLNEDPQKLTLLRGACLISQWSQPTEIHCTINVYNQFNGILKLVYTEIEKSCPNHPVLKRGVPVMNKDTGQVLTESIWSPQDCRTILCAVSEVMFNTLNFHRTDNFLSTTNIYIEKVLLQKSGIPITLAIVYETIAAQFGVACLPVNFPGYFLLKWLEHPLATEPDSYTFIDVFNKGAFKSWRNLEDLAPSYENFTHSWLDAVSPVKVFVRMCWNLVEIGRQRDCEGEGLVCLCNALELLSLLSPADKEHKLLLARVYMHLSINMTRVISLLQEVSDSDPSSAGIIGFMYRAAITNMSQRTPQIMKVTKPVPKPKVQPRSEDCDVHFAVGMIMKHKKYNYRCVIYGWDSVCVASEDWIKQMGVNNLPHKDKQPFYLVLVEDGSNRYAAQENLEIDCENKPVEHFGIGRFFESFHGNYYLPNTQKMEEYPDDIKARERALSAVQSV